MGVHELWSILEPVRESVPLYSLSGKTLAVDLSLWVCEALHVQGMMGRVTKPHLRNLFFRVSSLTLMGVKLVFVMEGEAPKIKAETMNKRSQTRYGGFKKAAASKVSSNPSRGRFRAVLRECAEMLDYLGVPWVTAAGEAEAMCAYLDSQGLVDGCITNDGDAFLYGARTVYRNFNMNSKDPQVNCYQTSHVQTELHLSREDLVGLAILLGCDYIPKGVPGVGKEQALRLIQALKGQSLLQRFMTWKKEVTEVSDGVVKKVSHCNICRHPGSAKAHERGGCTLCDSLRFCQPHDFDYQCPCDWHRHEQTRQALSFEANIRRKTLASEKFPFTEIISEFLVSKDKPVSHFKRRQPNMLLMQKFAYDKMEWPKHYTSEKVLILMSYTELMNRKHGRDMTPQMEPIRILKPRVKNGIACFEVIWRTPAHFVFPEEQPEDDQQEVTTVEEESLFRAAFPELLDDYLRDKALAEENKTKKKKTKSKKEKPGAASDDGVSRLLEQMTLQSSSSTNPATRTQTLPHSSSSTNEPEVVVLDTPVSSKHHSKETRDPDAAAPRPDSDTAASPSVSVVIDALHLSDIDWDALSFTSSPTPPANQTTEPESKAGSTEQQASSGASQADSRSAPELCYTECSLRDRLLMRNTAKTANQTEADRDMITKQLHYGLSSCDQKSDSKPNTEIPPENINDAQILKTTPPVKKNELLTENIRCGTNKVEKEALKKHKTADVKAESDTEEKPDGSKKPPQKYTFVRAAVSSLAAPPQTHNKVPGRSDKKDISAQQIAKKSVCKSVCSSSEDSDTENRPTGSRQGVKTKHINKNRSALVSDLPLKTLCVPAAIKPPAKATQNPPSIKPNSQSHCGGKDQLVSGQNVAGGVLPAAVDVDASLQTPASPFVVSDSDDSVICSESPLPLAERLRLKFVK